MREALLILRKDVDHQRWPLFAFLLLMASRMVIDSLLPHHTGLVTAQTILGILFFTAAIGLMYESVRQERIIGDQQYWLTRPFPWHSVLAAKALFLVLFVLLPVLLSGAVALGLNGVWPAPSFSPVMTLLLIGGFVTSAASVTRTTVQFVLTLVCYFLVGVLSATLQGQIMGYEAVDWGSAQGVHSFADTAIESAALAAVIWLQYRRRATTVSRILFAAGVLVSMIGIPGWHAAFSVLEKLKGAGSGSTVQVAFDLARAAQTSPGSWGNMTRDDVVGVRIPVAITGIPKDGVLGAERVRTQIDTPAGRHWDSGWRSVGGIIGRPDRQADPGQITGQTAYWLEINIDRSFYDSANLKDTPVRVESTAAFASLSPPTVLRLPIPCTAYRARPGEFCSISVQSGERLNITCLSASAGSLSDAVFAFASGRHQEAVPVSNRIGAFSVWSIAAAAPSALNLTELRFDRFQQPDLTRMPDSMVIATRETTGYFERSFVAGGIRLGAYEAGRSAGRRSIW